MSEQPPSPTRQRRSSFADFFGGRGNTSSTVSSSPPASSVAGSPGLPHSRGGSITAPGGLGGGVGALGQTNPYTAFARQRRASVATSTASSSPEFKNSFSDESAVVEVDEITKAAGSSPVTPFARRLSFGAQALRDVKSGSPGSANAGAGRRPSTSLFKLDEQEHASEGPAAVRLVSSGTAKTGGEGFNWSEALRDRTKRSPSFSSGNPFAANANKLRPTSASFAGPPKEMPKPAEGQPLRMKKPDQLGERMLRGEFMMD
ncbi:hypothetical protein DV736_g104, partial [Chaetothyriales sp. CBS 134916]